MRRVAFDTETHLITDQVKAPPLVCLSWADDSGAYLVSDREAAEVAYKWFADSTVIIEGHNLGGFDLPVLLAHCPDLIPSVFQAVADGRVFDTMIEQKILDVAMGCFRGMHLPDGTWEKHNYGLADLVYRYTGYRPRKGADTWRLDYDLLHGVPLDLWPDDARDYAIGDAVNTRGVRGEILGVRDTFAANNQGFDLLCDSSAQTRAALWLGLMQVWGIRIDVTRLRILEEAIRDDYRDAERTCMNPFGEDPCDVCGKAGCWIHGLVRNDVARTRDVKRSKEWMRRAMAEQGRPCKMTATGVKRLADAETAEAAQAIVDEYISLDKEACDDSDDYILEAYARLGKLKSVLSKDVPAMSCGEIHADFDSFLRTSRTSCRGYNLQNPSTKGGVRECFIPRYGTVFLNGDLGGAELRGMAQACIRLLGWSTLADALNAGQDPHITLGANLTKISYAEGLAAYLVDSEWLPRKMAKVGNFGFAGGMGPKKFRLYAKTKGVVMTLEEVVDLKAAWLTTWPEFAEYFEIHGDLTRGGAGWFIEESSGRLHSGMRFSQACNLRFQALIASAAKAAGWALCRACYDPTVGSVLYGSRPVNFIHDEYILEVPEPIAAECAEAFVVIVKREVGRYLPDIPPTIEPLLSRCWSKKAFALHDASGRLIPWNGEAKGKAA